MFCDGKGKKIGSYSLSPEAEGERDYVSSNIASYLQYNCSYCPNPFYLVDPESHEAGGAVQRELIKNKDTGEILGVMRTIIVCIPCIHDIMRRQQVARS